MKLLAVAAAAASLLFAATLGVSASASSHSSKGTSLHLRSIAPRLPTFRGITTRHALIPMQTGPTATATSQPTPEPTATTSPYPDPVGLLNSSIDLFGRVTKVHFQDVFVGDQTSVEHLSINAKGVANCSSELVTVTASDNLMTLGQKSSQHFEFVQKGKKLYKKPLTGSNRKWKAAKLKDVAPFGFSIDNPLACPAAGTTTGSSGNTGLTDLVNVGPVVYHGVNTWHLTATEVSTDASGDTSSEALDFYISQTDKLPYGYKVSIADPTQSITLSFEQILTQFNKKVSIPTPKVGASKP